ncbi:hypothetical protein BC832DRAFT_549028 [Gaertneriomyces semiglobifer]|nr:hypothetical protein BC832DRAFT_549028 [Gaertneriomyces semiglobifer]
MKLPLILPIAVVFVCLFSTAYLLLPAAFSSHPSSSLCFSQVCPKLPMRNSLVGFYAWLAIVAICLALAQRSRWGRRHEWRFREMSLSLPLGWRGARRQVSYPLALVWTLVFVHQLLQWLYVYRTYFNASGHPRPGPHSSSIPSLHVRAWQATYRAFGFSTAIQLSLTLLPTARQSLLANLFHIPYDASLSFHRSSGCLTILFATVHFIAYGVYAVAKSHGWTSFLRVTFMIGASESRIHSYRGWLGPVGLLSLVAFLFIGVTSMPYIRRRFYSFFHMAHFVFVPAIVLAMVHASPMFYYVLPAIALYVTDAVMRWVKKRQPYTLQRAVIEPNGYIRLDIDGWTSVVTPGQWVTVNIPAISSREWHPFTVASSAPISSSSSVVVQCTTRDPERQPLLPILGPTASYSTLSQPGQHQQHQQHREQASLCLLIKPTSREDSWTLALSRLPAPTPIHIDGPHGILPPGFLPTPHLLLVAGGSGLPGALALATAALDSPVTQSVTFWWTVKEPNAGMTSLWRDLERHPRATQVLDRHLVVTGGKERMGRVDVGEIFERWLGRLPNGYSPMGASASRDVDTKISVYTCGPPSLMRSVRTQSARLASMRFDPAWRPVNDEEDDPEWGVRGDAGMRRVEVLLMEEGYGR